VAVHFRVDVSTGAGLGEALSGVRAVVDASNPRRLRDGSRVLVGGTRRLLDAEAKAGVAHHVLISVVGVERVPLSYYRTKLEQENALRGRAPGWSIVRATQFHQLLDRLFDACAKVGILPRSRVPLQPVGCREVAIALADAVDQGSSGERPARSADSSRSSSNCGPTGPSTAPEPVARRRCCGAARQISLTWRASMSRSAPLQSGGFDTGYSGVDDADGVDP